MSTEERSYLWNGQVILPSKYPDLERANKKFDQEMDEPLEESVLAQSSLKFNKTDNKVNNNNSGSYEKNAGYLTQTKGGFNETNATNNKRQYNLIEEKYIESLNDFYLSRVGYVQNDPDQLFKFFLKFRRQDQKGQKVHIQIRDLMKFNNDDILYSIKYYHNKYIQKLQGSFIYNSRMGTGPATYYGSGELNNSSSNMKYNGSNGLNNTGYSYINYNGTNGNFYKTSSVPKRKKGMSKETLNRLYPFHKPEDAYETSNCFDIGNFFVKIMNHFRFKNNDKMTNDEGILFNFWRTLDEKEVKEYKLQWENGADDFEVELKNFLSDEEIMKRLRERFTKLRGFVTYHPRPLHDYWEKQIYEMDKYYLGLNKYNKDDMFKILLKKYKEIKEEEEKKRQEKEKEKEEIIKKESNKYKVTKKQYNEILKKIRGMAKPKDRYKTGRVMLRLKEQFKYDNIIQKMLKQEFKDNKLFKFPEEYSVRDEDEQNERIFKLGLNKFDAKAEPEIRRKREEKIVEQMKKTFEDDKEREEKEKNEVEAKIREDLELEEFIRSKVIEYYKKMVGRLKSGKIELFSKFLNNMYIQMGKKHKNATRRRFRKTHYETLKKAYKFKKLHTFYPENLKHYFFRLLRRLGKNEKGKYVFAKVDTLSFFAPVMSNKCKIHGNNCPLYCIRNTHNDEVLKQRKNNFKRIYDINNQKLYNDEKFNMWKRPELIKEKEKIFMCYSDAKNCTFEPEVVYFKEQKMTAENMTKDELIEIRKDNMKWVNKMGNNFIDKYPLKYKEGVCKRARVFLDNGQYQNCEKELKKAFNLDEILKYFDPEGYKLKKEREKKRKEKEENKERNQNEPSYSFNPNSKSGGPISITTNQNKAFKKKEDEISRIVPDNFGKPKNLEICREVYDMMLIIKSIKSEIRSNKRRVKELREQEREWKEIRKKLMNDEIVVSRNVDNVFEGKKSKVGNKGKREENEGNIKEIKEEMKMDYNCYYY